MTPDRSVSDTAREVTNQAANAAKKAANRVSEFEERMESGVRNVSRQIREQSESPVATAILDAFRNVPKLISPRMHCWLDVAVTAYYITVGIVFTARRRTGPAIGALVNGGMVACMSILTDYDGDRNKPISFKMHGTLDAVQAATAALAPAIGGFADESEASFFYGQAGNEVAVIATTDWDAGMPAERALRRAA